MNEHWLKSALLGVDRHPEVAAGNEVDALLARLAGETEPALAFSRSAGVLAACAQAAVRIEPALAPPPSPAGEDARALPANHAWTRALAAAFVNPQANQGYDVRLRHEACCLLAQRQMTLPFAILAKALDAGARSQALRVVLLPVLGARGRWLARHNPDWKFAAATAAQAVGADDGHRAWLDGQHVERLAYFRQLRTTDPARARELLQAGLAELGARERAEFVAALAQGLQPADEALLESLLKDRSREVRSQAADLLASLPASAHARRLLGWMEPLLTLKKGLLGRSWECEAPQAVDPAWAGAGIDPKRPQHETLGERAWWLYQLLRQVPLSWWTGQTRMKPEQLLAWAGKTDWKDALLRGWRERVDASEPEWITAMLALKESRPHAARLLALLPVAQRESYWPRSIAKLAQEGLLADVTTACALGETLSPEYSRPLFSSLLESLADDRLRHDYGLRAYLLELAALVHPEALRGLRAIPRQADETPAMAECAQEFERIVHARATLHFTS